MRTCNKCHQVKDESEFHKDRTRVDGLAYVCKACRREQTKHYRETNHALVLERQRQYKALNKDKIKSYYQQNREDIAAQRREYRKMNPSVSQRAQARVRRYYEKYPERELAAKAVQDAVHQGKLKPARKQKCADCGKKAHHLHHESYEPKDWLKVIPLCRICHKKRHMSSKV